MTPPYAETDVINATCDVLLETLVSLGIDRRRAIEGITGWAIASTALEGDGAQLVAFLRDTADRVEGGDLAVLAPRGSG